MILDLCGGTGAWSRPYREAGYIVHVITLPTYDVTKVEFGTYAMEFIRQDVHYRDTLTVPYENVYGILAAPPCTEFSFARTNGKNPTNFREGMKTVDACLRIIWECKYKAWDNGKINGFKFWALENPNGYLRHFLGQPAYNFQPWEYGDPYTKSTDLWGKFNIPEKSPVELDTTQKKQSHRNLRDLPPIPEDYVIPKNTSKRAAARAITPAGFAEAFFKANK